VAYAGGERLDVALYRISEFGGEHACALFQLFGCMRDRQGSLPRARRLVASIFSAALLRLLIMPSFCAEITESSVEFRIVSCRT